MGSVVRRGEADYGLQVDSKPDWVHLGTHVTHIPDVEYPWHADDVREIRLCYDEGFVPIFRRMAFRSPNTGEIVVFKHHGCAWRDRLCANPDPVIEVAEFPCTGYGSDWAQKYGHCNSVFWYELAPRRRPMWCQKDGLPGPHVPWGKWIVRMAEETMRAARTAAAKMLVMQEQGETARLKKVAEYEKSEAAYRQKSEAPYQKRLIEGLGVDDYRAMAAPPSHRSIERRPFVHLSNKG